MIGITVKKSIALFGLLGLCSGISAQYYYKDILINQQAKQNWLRYHQQKVATVTLVSLEENGEPTPGFSCVQEISKDGQIISTATKSTESTPTTLITQYSAQGQVLKTIDTSDTYSSISNYTYDASGRVISISNESTQTDNHISSNEWHGWTYNAAGTPVQMIKIKDGVDTTLVRFVADEKGNVVEERPEHHGQKLQAYYYYYTPEGWLTDIVRYNEKAQRLLPDYIFEYNAGGQASSMLFVPAGTNQYEKWIYVYDDKGLKTNETGYNKRQQTIGKIDYRYRFQ